MQLRAAIPHRAQVLALDQLHREVVLALDATRVEHLHEVRVVEPHHDLRLVEKAAVHARVVEVVQHLLHDARLLEATLAGRREEQLAHAAARHRPHEHVLAEQLREPVVLGARSRAGLARDAHGTRIIAVE
jgi:hypothetical protein